MCIRDRLNIGKNLSVTFFAFHQGGKAEILKVIISQLRLDGGQRLNRYNVQGVADTIPEGTDSAVAGAVPVGYRLAVGIVKRRVHKYIRQGQPRAVKSRRVGGYDLKGGTGLSGGGGRCV